MSSIVFQGNTEEQIRQGCAQGDRRFQEMLYNMFSAKMFAVCLRYANEYNSAQDLLQEGFVKVFKNIEKFRGEGSFEGWVRRIFVNTAIEHYRKQVNLYALHDSEARGYEYYEENALETLKQEDIMRMIQKLSDGYRTVFNLYVVEGFSHKEIGDMMGISEGTSKSQLARARYLLQKMITESGAVTGYSQNG
ncbi:MAG TPA: RNA polymerase sigma factor [Chitinophagales bacterium]|nr:RNA polymerase sigma factor [Chitinophagales bacterium]